MSIAALNWAWTQTAPTSTAKLVLVALADHANADGECWPSMTSVAELAQCSSRQVSRHIEALEAAGLLTRVRRRGAAGRLGSYVYRLALSEQPSTTGRQRPVDTDDHRTSKAPTTGHPRPVPPDTHVRTEPSVEPSVEPPMAPAKPTRKPRKPDPIWDAVIEACGINPSEMTKPMRGSANKAVKHLRDIGATPDGIHARAQLHLEKWPNASLTPASLAKNYAVLGARPPARASGGWR